MAESVKRPYESPRRRAQAAATRHQILDAAQRLFEADGYAATTMAAIAREAGVALKTVYVAFETKGGVLRALWHLLLRGDEADVAVQDRSWYQAVLAEPDPVRRLDRRPGKLGHCNEAKRRTAREKRSEITVVQTRRKDRIDRYGEP